MHEFLLNNPWVFVLAGAVVFGVMCYSLDRLEHKRAANAATLEAGE